MRPLPLIVVLYTSIAAGSFASTPPAPSLVPTVAVRHRAAVATAQPSASSASAQASIAEEPLQQPPRAIPTGPSPLGLLVLALGSFGGIALATKLLAPLSGAWVGGAKLVFAAAVAGVISRTCCAPLEMVSTVMMCRGDECGSMGEELADAWRHDGMSGLFKGNGANCLKVAPSRGTQVVTQSLFPPASAAPEHPTHPTPPRSSSCTSSSSARWSPVPPPEPCSRQGIGWSLVASLGWWRRCWCTRSR